MALVVMRDSEIFRIDRLRLDGRHRTPEALAGVIAAVCSQYAVEVIVIEPGTLIEVAASALDLGIETVSLEAAWQEFGRSTAVQSNVDLCAELIAEYPRLSRFVGRLPAKGPIPAADRRRMVTLLAVAIGLTATRLSERSATN